MKALTLIQPWASLIILGFKQIETRSWDTSYRGPIAIHAGKTMPCRIGQRIQIGEFEVERDRSGLLLRSDLISWPYRLPLGEMIGRAELMYTRSTNSIECKPDDRNRALGDFSAGRFAWYLNCPQRMQPHVPMKGRLGLWNAPLVAEATECISCSSPIEFGQLTAWNCDGETYHQRCPERAA